MDRDENTYCDGRLTVSVAPYEMRMSHWVYPPRVTHRPTGRVLFDLTQSLWDVAGAVDEGDALALSLRRYPGARPPVAVRIDAASGVVVVAGRTVSGTDVETVLEATVRSHSGPA